MEKNHILNNSMTQSPSLFDALGTKALVLRNKQVDFLTGLLSASFASDSKTDISYTCEPQRWKPHSNLLQLNQPLVFYRFPCSELRSQVLKTG